MVVMPSESILRYVTENRAPNHCKKLVLLCYSNLSKRKEVAKS